MDDEVFALYTDLLRSVGTFLYGRRRYEAMAVWETDAALAAQSDLTADERRFRNGVVHLRYRPLGR
ncbi:hypothetical protein [Micromonospora tarapacensis]|uniref:hypothetical protein n=1 Tax=Micromonospora tarapacensis TaxID=2835305 RepID=UPI001E3F27B2|nr:hypothetical protein [Micromonospora tarapacensis]